MSSRPDNKFAHDFYTSRAWRKCREAFAASKQHLCERCLAAGKIEPGTEVHHKRYLTPENISDPAIALDWSNLELLCEFHHHEEHNAARHKGRRWSVNPDGSVDIPPMPNK